ncbi:hypothetical protein KDA_37460 [Dictyobacter alpinus]|uniref:Uncharacterized protein n=1 Tax=Dictyobacter alpinus TaxID=2014873 RepID=A0A402BAB8_9CHLR|nr:hypothetical protein [Dictyobacter alpinus]GCE28262.1 hypothetical protein KDA_37460 [Dictyobacter alpinus]
MLEVYFVYGLIPLFFIILGIIIYSMLKQDNQPAHPTKKIDEQSKKSTDKINTVPAGTLAEQE